MYRKLSRFLLVASLAVGFAVAPMVAASASDSSGVDVHNPPTGFANGPAANRIDIPLGYTVFWYIKEGTHNITPADDATSADGKAVQGVQKWGVKGSDDLTVDSDPFSVKFTKAGKYFYYSTVGGEGVDDHGQLSGMWGVVNVTDPNAATTTTTTQAPTTTTTTMQAPTVTTQPAAPGPTTTTAPTPAGVAGHVPTTAAPAPTTTSPTTKAEKDKKPKDGSSTTTSAPAAPGAVDLPAEAIVPNVSPNGTATQDGVVNPSSTPSGEAVALLKEKHGTKGVKLLIVTGLGIGALGIGTAGYKYAHRSSKYFPA